MFSFHKSLLAFDTAKDWFSWMMNMRHGAHKEAIKIHLTHIFEYFSFECVQCHARERKLNFPSSQITQKLAFLLLLSNKLIKNCLNSLWEWENPEKKSENEKMKFNLREGSERRKLTTMKKLWKIFCRWYVKLKHLFITQKTKGRKFRGILVKFALIDWLTKFNFKRIYIFKFFQPLDFPQEHSKLISFSFTSHENFFRPKNNFLKHFPRLINSKTSSALPNELMLPRRWWKRPLMCTILKNYEKRMDEEENFLARWQLARAWEFFRPWKFWEEFCILNVKLCLMGKIKWLVSA